MESTLDVATH